MTAPEITLALFYLFNVVRGVMYLPQIARLARDPCHAQAICCSTWAFWAGANAATAAYAVINVSDWVLFASGIVNMIGCLCVLFIAIWKRRGLSAARTA
jgi:hypothetical protein